MSRAFRERFGDKFVSLQDRARFCDVDCSGDPSLTVQADAAEVDINRIVARMEKGKPVPVFNGQAFFGDVSEFDGLQDALMKVQQADDLFMSYPAFLRERFDNDPVKFVEFLSDDKNLAEAQDLGLVVKRPAPPAPPPPPAAPAGV